MAWHQTGDRLHQPMMTQFKGMYMPQLTSMDNTAPYNGTQTPQNWGLMCQKQISRTGTSNYIPQYLWDVITCPCPWYLPLVQHSYIFLACLSQINGACCPEVIAGATILVTNYPCHITITNSKIQVPVDRIYQLPDLPLCEL